MQAGLAMAEVPKNKGGRPVGSKSKKEMMGRKGPAPDFRRIQKMARRATPKVIAMLSNIAADESVPASARIQAGNSILDRAFGKAAQHVEVTGKVETTFVDALQRVAQAAIEAEAMRDVTPDEAEPLVIDVEACENDDC